MTWSGRKRDLKRAFALTDSAGTTYFLIAGNDREYYNWTEQLQAAIGCCTPGLGREEQRIQSSMDEQPEDVHLSKAAANPTERVVVDQERQENDEQSETQTLSTESVAVSIGGDTEGASQVDGGPMTAYREESAPSSDKGVVIENTGPSCKVCTFVNTRGAIHCEMCNSRLWDTDSLSDEHGRIRVETPAHLESSVQDTPDMEDSTPEMEDSGTRPSETEDSGPRLGMRGRLGAAFRNVRRGGTPPRNARRGGTPPPAESGRRFGFMSRNAPSRQDTEDPSFGVTEAVKLRNISIAGQLTLPTDPFRASGNNAMEVPLKKLEGYWFVHVDVCLATQGGNRASHLEQKNLTDDKPHPEASSDRGETEGLPPSTSSQHLTLDTNSADDHANLLGDNDSEHGVIFQIKVVRRLSAGNQTQIVSELKKSIPDVLAMHTTISESISHLPSSPYSTTELARTPSGDMSKSLASVLGLNAVETVRITGRMLGGLLVASLSDGSEIFQRQACK
jgi:hypothetical protein